MTREEAIALGESKWWVGLPAEEVARRQLNQRLLIMDFSDFQMAVEKALDRPVYTHEFIDFKSLLDELDGKINAPSLEDTLNKLPLEKTIVLVKEKCDDI